MSTAPRPRDRVQAAPGAQAIALGNGQLLFRHPRGLSLLTGFAPKAARELFRLCAEPVSVADLCRALRAEQSEEKTRELVGQLLGEALRRLPADGATGGVATSGESHPTPSSPAGGRAEVAPSNGLVTVLANGPMGTQLSERLVANGLEVRSLDEAALGETALADLAPRLEGSDLVLVLLEDTLYSTLFEVQGACLRGGLASLFATYDADGFHLGPATLGGAPPCLACARLAGLRGLGLEDDLLVEALGHFRTRPWPTESGSTIETLAAVAHQMAEGRRTELSGHLLQLHQGSRRQLPIDRPQGCPLCQIHGLEGEGRPRKPPRQALGARATVARLEAIERYEQGRRHGRSPFGPEAPRSVGILGGGTAGYLAALALRRRLPQLEVTVVESSRVPVIGVGEATTPLLPQFLHVDLGFDIHDFFRQLQPTLKLGIRFAWGGNEEGAFNYPFGAMRLLDAQAHEGHVGRCSLRSMLMSSGRVPLFEHQGRCLSRLDTEVAYHLDNRRFVAYLRDQARRCGVRFVDATVAEAEVTEGGVGALVGDDGRRFSFDLYLDCSGFRSLLLGETLEDPFIGFEGSLFTDRAITAEAPNGGRPEPHTLARAMESGWCWSTPQRDADHRGYVYSSEFCDEGRAIDEMHRRNPGMGEPQTLRFRPGRRRSFWRGNVFALGNAYGFVEPLESTALHMLVRQVALLVKAYPWTSGGQGEGGLRAVLNRRVGSYWDYLRWFLALHFKHNHRMDSPFWQACRASADVAAHAELLEMFAARGPLSSDPAATRCFDYPDPLWGPEGVDLILLGQQAPTALPRPPWSRAAWQAHAERCETAAGQALPQHQALALLDERPQLLESLVRAFRGAGRVLG